MADPNEQPKSDDTSGEAPAANAEEAPAEGSTDSAGELGAESRAARRKKARAEATGGTDEVRDRNRRIREEAAGKRRAKRESEERQRSVAKNLDTSEIVDDALARTTHVLGSWLKRNINLVQWAVILLAVAGIGYQVFSYRRGINSARATEELVQGLSAEFGRVGAQTSPGPDKYTGLSDMRREFATEADQLKAAEAEYRQAEQSTSGTISALASLGLAGVLYDQRKYAEAEAAYRKVRDSKLAEADRDARGRALEGMGLALESQGKHDPALTAYRELENSDIQGLKELAQYHQARVLIGRGDRAKAKELLKKALEKLTKASDKPAAGGPPQYVETQVRELLASVDPTAVPRPSGGMSAEQLERLKAQLKMSGDGKLDAANLAEVLKNMGAPAPAPAAPAPANSGTTP